MYNKLFPSPFFMYLYFQFPEYSALEEQIAKIVTADIQHKIKKTRVMAFKSYPEI